MEYPADYGMADHALGVFDKVREMYLDSNDIYLAVIPDKNRYLAEGSGYLSMDYEAFSSYMKEQIGKETHSVDIIDTGNTLINAVLNIKFTEAKERNIAIPIIADNLSDVSISDSDLVTILTNILDNAIEAVMKCSEKKIVFKILKDNDMLIVDSMNPYLGQLPNEDEIVSTKADKKNHGYGLANIRKTVAANNGSCFIETENSIFHITIAIPLT